jgi:hypothetical protein
MPSNSRIWWASRRILDNAESCCRPLCDQRKEVAYAYVQLPSQVAKRFLSRQQIDWLKRQLARPLAHDLDRLARLYWTDKRSGGHGYTEYYARHLQSRRRSVTRILEIGIGGYAEREAGGHSLRMWRSYCPNATVVGVDIYEKQFSEPRIVTIQVDQSDADSLLSVASEWGPFDFIVDDGSHQNDHVILTALTLFPAVKPGGIYVIEDVETAYLTELGGGPPGTKGTSIDFVKSLIDPLHAHRFRDPTYADGLPTLEIASLHVYPNMVLLEKAKGLSD